MSGPEKAITWDGKEIIVCYWTHDGDEWEAQCDGAFFQLQHDRTPQENGFRRCPRCGLVIVVATHL